MATILAISSQVVRGHVGLSVITPVLQRLGHDVWPMPTIVLSNHPGHRRTAATRIAPDVLSRMIAALDNNGWLGAVDAVLTGYMPTAEHVDVAAAAIARIRAIRPAAVILVDPILGDDPKGLYIDQAAAAAIRDRLLPLATITTPNRFELAWLTGLDVTSVQSAVTAARQCHVETVIVTSIPVGDDRLANLAVTHSAAEACEVTRAARVPHGTGDMLSALLLAARLTRPGDQELGRAVAGVAAVVAASAGSDELQLVPSQAHWSTARPIATRTA